MAKLAAVLLLLAAAVLAAMAITPAQGGDEVSPAAKAAFLMKCIRDLGGRASCEAPAQARMPKRP